MTVARVGFAYNPTNEDALELRERRHDHRLLEGVRARRHRQDREGEAVVLAWLGHVVAQRNDLTTSPREGTAYDR